MGKILRVELSRKKIVDCPLSEELARKFVGTYGTAGKILYKEVAPWVDAFDPENRLIFSTGPLTGTQVESAGRYTVVTKSPLSGYFGDASSGGFWGPELKFSGYDMIVITGRAEKPTYLWVKDGKAELKDASPYWGMDARQTDRAIRKDLGDKRIRVADIGQAGENLVRYACIMHDEAGRAAGRCGVGAVMGFKNLKAVAVRGHKEVPVTDPDRLKKLANYLREYTSREKFDKGGLALEQTKEWFGKYGTAGYYAGALELGDSPVKNWTMGYAEHLMKLTANGGDYDKIISGHRTCYNCTVHCRNEVTVTEGPYSFEPGMEGPEYETLAALGGNCYIGDVKAVAKANYLCNLYGMDTISTGSTIAFAMECAEKGLLTKEDLGGVDLKFGNAEAIVQMVSMIAKRQSIGNLLAEGTRRAARLIGKGAEHYAIHVKGVEIAMHDPRAAQSMSLTYAFCPSGGRHTAGIPIHFETGYSAPSMGIEGFPSSKRFETEGKAYLAKKIGDWWFALNALGFCLFPPHGGAVHYPFELQWQFYEAVTGWPMTREDFYRLGERIMNLKRAFNFKHGMTKGEDTLPKRLLTESHKEGSAKGVVAKLDEMVPEYLKLRGWDPMTHKPTRKKLEELGLHDIAEDLWSSVT